MIFDALSNAAYRVSLRDPGVELEGAFKTPHQMVENLEHIRARVNVSGYDEFLRKGMKIKRYKNSSIKLLSHFKIPCLS